MAILEDAKVYRPLNVENREIRVLEILPRAPDPQGEEHESKVAVELKYCFLDNPVVYEALSYTWGDPGKKAIIRVDTEEEFIVRQSLERALRDLRLCTERRVIWIDALCINQADVAERNEQVKLMRKIYANASVVRSWLDQEIDPSKPALVRLQSLDEDSEVEDLDVDAEFWAPVGEILTNDYWFRIWVQQEIAYASKWTVQCRRYDIPTACLMRLALLLVMKLWGFYTDPLFDKTRWKALMPTVLTPLLYRSRRDDGQVSSSTFYGPLHRALREARNLKSTDPKDKIFAMLGMIDDYHEGDIDVDYGLSDEQVYTNLARLSIERYYSLDFLREATLGNLRPGHESFPTWLPDWSQPSVMDPFGPPNFSIADLRGNMEKLPSPLANISQGLLQVSGFCIGKVASVLHGVQQEHLWTGKLEIPALVAKFRAFKVLRDTIETPVPTEVISPDDYHTVYLFRAVSGADGRGIEQERLRLFSEIFRNLISASSIDHDDEACMAFSATIDADPAHFGDLVHYMQESCRGRFLFLTTDLCMGLVPQPALSDDEVWYIHGCATPIILRNEHHKYIVVGEAYVNDCMLWSSMDGVLETPQGLPLRDYHVRDITLC